MLARGNASAADDTFCGINFYFNVAIHILIRDIGHFHRTFPDAPVTACTKFAVCLDNFLHSAPTPAAG
jgi:hypothetical protein